MSDGRFLTGSTMGHVVRMTLTGAIGITFVFLVDAANLFWVSTLGDERLMAAIGYAFSIQFFTVSIGVGMMIAATALVSRAIGERERPRARRHATGALMLTVSVQALVALLVVLFRYPLLKLAGAEGETLDIAARYLFISIPTLIIMAVGLVGSAVLRAEGDGHRAMYVTLTSGSVAMFADPFLIVVMGWGVEGAAMGVGISRVVMAIVALRFAVGTHDLFARPSVICVKEVVRPFAFIALPVILTQIATPFGNFILTAVMADYGDAAVAAWAVVTRLTVVAFGGLFALSGAVGGIFGQNYGASLYDRLVSTYRDSLKFCLGYTFLAWALLIGLTGFIIRGFGIPDEAAAVVRAFTYVGAGAFVFNGLLFVSNAAFNTLGKPQRSTLVNWLREGILTYPVALMLSAWLGAVGVIYTQAVLAVVVGSASALWGWYFVRSFGSKA